ncbi:GGDEF domain-containing protein [Lysinibacillus fusiformis]|uniref:GGDEF domain-containing protein n=2 Tax=Lysinibacillus fusiformis TaxID=28031 RepID=UPI00088805EA|nr:GGDEF domain-containing protein [Lysinibacillus fusiformis]SCX63341.1 diguanylate cyclase (GGDEF) domain-containing protein [Lysinibacillus fusiformis]SDB46106.1 diguanylate cyclase (GGDEF) domain-containing protein [Lysinibacillus fusiformis]SFI72372.1 diguanylate cyclase (GGDEF) domain-containing protein [Lysinibacillus fusiformis]SFT15428.1 diguanylate cyclase (GGDEF) domain-containing protein [Lysinibacillus fusiformis]
MPLLTIILSALYQCIRLQFNMSINMKNARKENMLLLFSQLLLLLSAGIYIWLPLQLNFYIPFLIIGVFLVEFNKPWLTNEHFISKTAIVLLVLATFIPFVKGIALIVLIIYMIYGGFKYGELKDRSGVLIMSVLAFITVTTNTDTFVWSGATIYFIMNHIKHTKQLLGMMKNASKNVITDTLTGLYNRRWLYKKSEQLIQQQEIGIIFCDIDNFKKLNDEKGHDHGDLVLQQTGEIMRRILNGNGFGVRYGGEELIGLVTNTMHTSRLAEKILEAVRKEIKITMSIGIAVGQGSVEELIKTADERMYISKNTGKNKITIQEEIFPS